MKTGLEKSALSWRGVVLLALFVSGAMDYSQAAGPSSNKAQYSWEDVAKWPDFTTGSWGTGVANSGGLLRRAPFTPPGTFTVGGNLPFTDQYRQEYLNKDSKQNGCEPLGVIADSGSKFIFSKDIIVIGSLSDFYNVWRRVYMDGRGHPPDAVPSYFGHSIGHWDGDTLVIDTISIRAESQIGLGIPISSDRTHVVERIRLLDRNILEIKKTITNPDVFTKPAVVTIKLRRHPTEDFPEAYCWSSN